MNRKIKVICLQQLSWNSYVPFFKKRFPPTLPLVTHTIYKSKNSSVATHQCFKTIILCIGTDDHHLKYLFSVSN